MRIANSWLIRAIRMSLVLGSVFTAFASVAHGGDPGLPHAVPEIDPGSIGSALTVLICGALMLTGRSRKS